MINMHTKFEVSVFTHYEDMKQNAKCRNWGGLGVKVTQYYQQCHHSFDRAHMTSYSTNRNYASILYHFRVIASYLSKVTHFNLPLYLAPPLWVILFGHTTMDNTALV